MAVSDPVQLATGLARQGRLADALSVIATAAATGRPSPEVLELQAALFKASDDPEAALEPQRRVTRLYPERRSGWHNLAATLGDLGLAADAEAAARRSLTIPPNAPETFLVLARSLQSQGRYDEAEAALARALAIRPAYGPAHHDLAQLRWMRTGDTGHALAHLAAGGDDPELALIRASVLEFAGDAAAAHAAVSEAITRAPGHPGLRLAAARLDLALGRTAPALAQARMVYASSRTPAAMTPLIQALLAAGLAEEASGLAAEWVRAAPNDQLAIALQLSCWRALGDPRYQAMTDPAQVVGSFTLPTPPAWPSLEAYLDDLRRTLLALHDLHTHPLHQSLRGGSQTSQSLLRSRDPVITAFFEAIQVPLGAYLQALGAGDDPLRRRNTGAGRPKAAWSVKLRAGGRHADHVHPQGWISSAFYVATPRAAVDAGDQAGWIRFGQPPFPTSPPQGPRHAVRPEPGLLVLFPSYLWHGTVPFETEETRLTIAFDVLPA